MMEVAGKYRMIASVCLLVATISAFGRWRLSVVPIQPSSANPEKTSAGPTPTLTPPKLESPTFLKFKSIRVTPTGTVDLADDGSVLESELDESTGERTYSYLSASKSFKKLPSDDPATRFALSQRGRLFKFRVNPSRLGFGRRVNVRLTLSELLAPNSGPYGTSRRFLEDGAMVSYEYSAKTNSINIVREGKPTKTVLQSQNQLLLGQVDDRDELWTWEVRNSARKPEFHLFRGQNVEEVDIAAVGKIGVPKLVTTTNGASVLTVCTKSSTAVNRAFRSEKGAWKEILPPPGFDGVMIQKISEDGLMFGALQIGSVDLVPTVWRDGIPYDLRRHPQWPLGGHFSFAELVNRRGDIIATSLVTGDDRERTSTLLTRLPAK